MSNEQELLASQGQIINVDTKKAFKYPALTAAIIQGDRISCTLQKNNSFTKSVLKIEIRKEN